MQFAPTLCRGRSDNDDKVCGVVNFGKPVLSRLKSNAVAAPEETLSPTHNLNTFVRGIS